MANRSTRFLLKNSTTSGQTLPVSGILQGEPLVNLYNGVMFFSGTTGGDYTTGNTNTGYFEVGSHLTNLKLDGRLQRYDGQEGAGLVGQFLSGTTNGFVLAPISSIVGVDTYVTGFTYDNANTITLSQNNGQPDYSVTLNQFTGLTINGDLSVTGNTNTNNIYVTTSAITNNLSITGTGYYSQTATGASSNELINYGTLTGFSQTNDVYVTGSTLTPADNNTNIQSSQLLYHGTPIGGPYTIDTENTFTTGGTYSAGTITFTKNDSTTYQVTGIDGTDTYVTGFTYNPSNNTLTISRNEGEPDLTAYIDSVSGLTINGNLNVTGTTTTGTISATTYNTNLTPGKVVYVGPSGELKVENEFGYNDGTDTLTVDNIEVSQDVTISGSLTVLGSSISAFTTNLYVEDPNITLNYNPTGDTSVTSVNSGFVIQDGNGITGGDVDFEIVRMQNLTGLTPTEIPNVSEYTSTTGYSNRGWITQLNDIVIRSTDVTDGGSAGDINGVRVLTEFDTLDGGFF